jgi:hypothetical protein
MDHLWLLLKRIMDIGQFALFTFCVERKQIQKCSIGALFTAVMITINQTGK